EYRYNTDNMLERAYNPRLPGTALSVTQFTEYTYDNRNNITNQKHPDLGPNGGVLTESWIFDAATGHLTEHHDVKGVVWTYGYNEAQHDPDKTGLPTSRSVTLSIGRTRPVTLTWEMVYNRSGRLVKTYEPTFGAESEYEYHP